MLNPERSVGFKTGTSWKVFLAFGLLLVALWLPRGLALDRFVTPDEPAWIGRSVAFSVALTQHDLAGTFQHGHPGVTLTWAGGMALRWVFPDLAGKATPKVLKNWQNVEPFLRENGLQPIDVLQLARSIMVLGNVLALGSAFFIARRLVDLWPALVGFLLIAFDPFDAGLTRLLHLDGLLSSLMLLSLVAFMSSLWSGASKDTALNGWPRLGDLGISAGAAGLSWLTKSPGIFLVGFIGLLGLIDFLNRFPRHSTNRAGVPSGQLEPSTPPEGWPRDVWRAARPATWRVLIWCGLAAAVFVVLWPAMWVHPLDTLGRVFGQAFAYASEGHDSQIFFNGQVISGDPGWLFYPITWFWRTTPPVLIGLLLALLAWVGYLKPFDRLISRRTVVVLLLFSLSYALAISFSAKKFDRYLLPVYGPLDIIAGMGWVAGLGELVRRVMLGRVRSWRILAMLGLALSVLPVVWQAATALPTFPYYLSYYNPLLGGGRRAPQVMMIGWGEGLDQAARYLNMLPDAPSLRVMTHYPDGCFSYFFQGKALNMLDTWDGPDTEWLQGIDYLVLYVHQWQRQQPDPRMLAYFAGQKPAYVVRLNGITYVQVYQLVDK